MASKISNVHLLGCFYVASSAICYSSAGFFTRLISTDVWTLLCVRGVFASIFLLLYLLIVYRGRVDGILATISWPATIAMLASAIAMIFNLNAYRNTAVANVVVIYAVAPFIAAGLAWLAMREPFPRHTVFASLIAFVGVLIMTWGSFVVGNLFGDVLALGMTFFMAVMMVAIRMGAKIDMVPAAFMSAFMSIVLTMPFADFSSVRQPDLTYMAIFGVVQLGLGLLFLTEGTRRIPASQAALIGSLDVPLAAFWVWLAFAEVPPVTTIIGGSIVLLAVFGHMQQSYAAAAELKEVEQS